MWLSGVAGAFREREGEYERDSRDKVGAGSMAAGWTSRGACESQSRTKYYCDYNHKQTGSLVTGLVSGVTLMGKWSSNQILKEIFPCLSSQTSI